MPFMVTQASSVMMSSPSPTNGAQDLHENLLSIGDAAFPGLSNQNELNWTELSVGFGVFGWKYATTSAVCAAMLYSMNYFWRICSWVGWV